MPKSFIQAQGMSITYNEGKSNEFKALTRLDADIYKREYIILFGPSGCGKSTLMYSVLGSLPPSEGRLFVGGEDIYAYKPSESVAYQRSTVGIVYQQFNLLSSLTVIDNVALPLIFSGVSPKERKERSQMLLERFGIAHVADKLPSNLSGGQQQRVAVARSLIGDPAILLGDEPVGNLDSVSAEQVMGKLAEINERDRKTVILVTHDAKYLPEAHRIFYLKDGVIRRIVVNPEKRQIKRTRPGETIVTEIEQLARLYPYSEPLELKVKSAVNFLTQKIDFYQLEKLEKTTQLVLAGKMGKEMFYELLSRPIHEGGIGIAPHDAKDMTRRVEQLITYSHDVQRYREEIHNNDFFLHQHKFIERLETYLLEACGITLSGADSIVFRTAIGERVGGITTRDMFQELLALSPEMGGLDLPKKVAHEITRHLEKLIAQGGYLIESRQNEGEQDKRA